MAKPSKKLDRLAKIAAAEAAMAATDHSERAIPLGLRNIAQTTPETSPTITQILTVRFGSWDSIQDDPEQCYYYIRALQREHNKRAYTEIQACIDAIDYGPPYQARILLALSHLNQALTSLSRINNDWNEAIRGTLRDIPDYETQGEGDTDLPHEIRNHPAIKRYILGILKYLDIDRAMCTEAGYIDDRGKILTYDPPDTLEDYLARCKQIEEASPSSATEKQETKMEPPVVSEAGQKYLASEAYQTYLKIRAECLAPMKPSIPAKLESLTADQQALADEDG